MLFSREPHARHRSTGAIPPCSLCSPHHGTCDNCAHHICRSPIRVGQQYVLETSQARHHLGCLVGAEDAGLPDLPRIAEGEQLAIQGELAFGGHETTHGVEQRRLPAPV